MRAPGAITMIAFRAGVLGMDTLKITNFAIYVATAFISLIFIVKFISLQVEPGGPDAMAYVTRVGRRERPNYPLWGDGPPRCRLLIGRWEKPVKIAEVESGDLDP